MFSSLEQNPRTHSYSTLSTMVRLCSYSYMRLPSSASTRKMGCFVQIWPAPPGGRGRRGLEPNLARLWSQPLIAQLLTVAISLPRSWESNQASLFIYRLDYAYSIDIPVCDEHSCHPVFTFRVSSLNTFASHFWCSHTDSVICWHPALWSTSLTKAFSCGLSTCKVLLRSRITLTSVWNSPYSHTYAGPT